MSRQLDRARRQPASPAPSTQHEGARRQARLLTFLGMQTKDVMTKLALTVSRQLSLRELEHLFETYDFNGFPVVEDHRLIGIVTKFDFLKNFVFTPSSVFPHYDDLMKRTVEEIMMRKVCTVHSSTPLTRVLQLMVDTRDKSLPVVDEKNRSVGIISRGDIVRALLSLQG
jgi:CBS-domain-containing membrane protein